MHLVTIRDTKAERSRDTGQLEPAITKHTNLVTDAEAQEIAEKRALGVASCATARIYPIEVADDGAATLGPELTSA